jgi:endonuclease/exonuclease/phosphatase family metal-dependent hydrolase
MAPLLFRRSAFALLASGWFWLSETPEIPGSKSWNSAYPRTVNWARLACQISGALRTYVNTHFDYEPTAIDGDARTLRHWLNQIRSQRGGCSIFHAFGEPEELAAIDWILVSGHFHVLDGRSTVSTKGNIFPSNHYPVTAVFDWKV